MIVTSFLFPDAKFSLERLEKISSLVGKERLVVDVRCGFSEIFIDPASKRDFSCRRKGDKWFVAMDKWQRITEMEVCQGALINCFSSLNLCLRSYF